MDDEVVRPSSIQRTTVAANNVVSPLQPARHVFFIIINEQTDLTKAKVLTHGAIVDYLKNVKLKRHADNFKSNDVDNEFYHTKITI